MPAPPPHQHRIESRKDMPPAPPSPFRDRGPAPPPRDVSLGSSSLAAPSNANVDSDYAEVGEVMRRTLVRNDSPYSEVDDTGSISEVEAYFTTDVVRNMPTKSCQDIKRVSPPKPLPYKLKSIVEDDDSQQQPPTGPNLLHKPPPKPAPFQPKNIQENVPHKAVSSDQGKLQSPVSPTSPRLPVVMPGSPRLASAKLVSSAPSSTSSSPTLDRPPKFKPPPPPRVSSVADATKEEVTYTAQIPDEESRLNSFPPPPPVNGILEGFDEDEIPTRDTDVALSSKPVLPRKPQLGSKPNHTSHENGPPSFKPPPPPKLSSLVPRAYGVKSGTFTSDRDRAGSQNGGDFFGVIAPPRWSGWMANMNGQLLKQA
ncbi:hypothetical protein OS493_036696 [Desmophyllum pertusum]|uniref:Uncharacterized protein n=1 Tax=Desmophyllum pertusum TaxID=174260 RepID=A0A9W9ZII9_9CNID|nr:hypothetical protein OS493_036696 [Desmophyllum pertusum]